MVEYVQMPASHKKQGVALIVAALMLFLSRLVLDAILNPLIRTPNQLSAVTLALLLLEIGLTAFLTGFVLWMGSLRSTIKLAFVATFSAFEYVQLEHFASVVSYALPHIFHLYPYSLIRIFFVFAVYYVVALISILWGVRLLYDPKKMHIVLRVAIAIATILLTLYLSLAVL